MNKNNDKSKLLKIFCKPIFWPISVILAGLIGLYIGSKPDIIIVSTGSIIKKNLKEFSSDTMKVLIIDKLTNLPLIKSFLKIETEINVEGEYVAALNKKPVILNKIESYNFYFPFSKIPEKVIKEKNKINITILAKNILNREYVQTEFEIYDKIDSLIPNKENIKIKIPEIKQIDGNFIPQKCQGFSKNFYKDNNGNIFAAKFTKRGSIDQICCRQTGNILNWRNIQESPFWEVRKDTLIIIENAINWLRQNSNNNYNELIGNIAK